MRSVVIEHAIRSELRQQSIAVTEVDELELINNAADQLNVEAADVLEYVSAFRINQTMAHVVLKPGIRAAPVALMAKSSNEHST